MPNNTYTKELRQIKANQLSAVLMALLIVMMPLVYAEPSENFPLQATVPEATKDNTIKITGITKPNINVEIILNKARIQEITSNNAGEFETPEITIIQEENEITIKAKDSQGNIRTLNYDVRIDMTPPIVEYPGIPEGTQTRTLIIRGTASEEITLKYRLNQTLEYTTLKTANKNFTASIDLNDGTNNLELIAEDNAGNQDKQEFQIAYDIAKPSFKNTNLDNLEPCYFDFPGSLYKEVDITGTASEKATILVYVNHESNPSKVRVTDENGHFRIKNIRLTREFKTNITGTTATGELAEKYDNHLRIVAKDLAGNTEEITKTLTCQTCGGGAAGYSLTLEEVSPSLLLPKLLIEGMEIITIPFNLTYTGINKARIQDIRITPVILAPEYKDDYDNQAIVPHVIKKLSSNRQSATGILQLNINKFDPLEAVEPDASQYRRKFNASRHRFGKCAIQTGLHEHAEYGCMRFFLIAEITYQEEIQQPQYLDPNIQQTTGPTLKQQAQKICIPQFEIGIDYILPDDFMPNKMVKKTIGNIDYILKKIEGVQKVLDTTNEYLMYSCLGALGTVTLATLAETTACTIGEWVPGKAKWSKDIAKIGICDDVYAEEFDEEEGVGIEGNQRARNACNWCSELYRIRTWLQYEIMNRACDRVGCPSALTLKKYMQNKKGEVKEITPTIKEHYDKARDAGISEQVIKEHKDIIYSEHAISSGDIRIQNGATVATPATEYGQIFVGSDCGFTINPKRLSITYDDISGAKGIQSIYADTRDPNIREYCTDYLRAAKPECCGIEYNKEFSTACGLGQISGQNIPLADTFDELEESTCLAARQAGKPETMQCNVLWNSLAGFCEPNTGDAMPEPVYTGLHYEQLNQDAEDNRVYIFLESHSDTEKEQISYKVYRGYVLKTIKYEQNKEEYSNSRELTRTLREVRDSNDLSQYFKGDATKETEQIKGFKEKICTKEIDQSECTNTKIKELYNKIKKMIGEPDKKYIVQPESSILRAIQCACIPAVKSWVTEWAQILKMLRNCLKTVELGKGDAGACDDFISQAVCDRIYDLLKCFASKTGIGNKGFRVNQDMGLGSLIGILTNTATDISQMTQSRYGESGMWNTLFNEKQLVHGICYWAFTGKWDMDISQVMEQTLEERPIESMPILGECKRYFRGYSPNTNPPGLANWAYQCSAALIAGTKINYKLELQCSDDMSCAEEDGFRNSQCDCMTTGTKTKIIETGTLNQGESFNKKITKMLQAGQGAGIRYDKAILSYEWKDPKTNEIKTGQAERYIRQGMPGALGFCAFDPFTSTFRCDFGEQEGSIRIEDIDKTYEKKHPTKGTKAFEHDKPFKFQIQVKQTMPDDAEKGKKFLYYKIYNQANNIIEEKNPPFDQALDIFESNGDYIKEISIGLDEEEVKDALQQVPGAQIRGWSEEESQQINGGEYIANYGFKENKENAPAVIHLYSNNDLKIYKFRSLTIGTEGFTEGTLIDEGKFNTGENKISATQGDNLYDITLDIKKAPEFGRIEIYLPRKQEGLESPWKTGDPAEWRIIFTIYDANEYGEKTEQISISPEGTAQQREERFKVMKTEGIGVEEETKEESKEQEKTIITDARRMDEFQEQDTLLVNDKERIVTKVKRTAHIISITLDDNTQIVGMYNNKISEADIYPPEK